VVRANASSHVLRVLLFGRCREADQVANEDGDDLALLDGGRRIGEAGSAEAAEGELVRVLVAAPPAGHYLAECRRRSWLRDVPAVDEGQSRGNPRAKPGSLDDVVDGLTTGERRVADLVARGWTNDEVARELSLRPKTVEWTLTKVYRKLQLRSRTELAVRIASARSEDVTGLRG
jgi:DNA-binding CsgD family transcriptional regulator